MTTVHSIVSLLSIFAYFSALLITVHSFQKQEHEQEKWLGLVSASKWKALACNAACSDLCVFS